MEFEQPDSNVVLPAFAELPFREAEMLRQLGAQPSDLPNFSLSELEALLGAPPSDSLIAVRSSEEVRFQTQLAQPATGDILRFLPPPSAPASSGRPDGVTVVKRARVAKEIRWGNAPSAAQPSVDLDRRCKAARRVGALLAGLAQSSVHGPDIERAAHLGKKDRWMEAFADALANRFDSGSMNHAAACWARWLRWRASQVDISPDAAAPLSLELATFLGDTRSKGPTAARGVFNGLRFIRDHLGVHTLPLDSPLLVAFRSADPGHLERPMAQAIQLKVWGHLLKLAAADSGTVSLLARIAALLAASSLRFRHAQRLRFIRDRCTAFMLVAQVFRGKARGGRPFWVAVPTQLGNRTVDLRELVEQLHCGGEDRTFLIPDVELEQGQGLSPHCCIWTRPMRYTKFVACLRALCGAPPLSLPSAQLKDITTYSLRRFLPTAADRLALPLADRAILGDWSDVPLQADGSRPRIREPMAVRYSDARLQSSVIVRAIILRAIDESLKNEYKTDEDIRNLSEQVCGFRRDILAQIGEPSAPPVAAEVASSTSCSPSSCDASVDSTTEAAGEQRVHTHDVPWITPKTAHSFIHAVADESDEHQQPVAWCRRWSNKAFAYGYTEGKGVDSAVGMNRGWCPSCAAHLRASGIRV